MWEEMANGIQKVAKEVLGESKGFGLKDKESQWWNENVQEKVKYKRECFKALQLCNNTKNWEKYHQLEGKQRRQLVKLDLKFLRGFIKHQKLRMENGKYIRLLK